MYIYIYIFCSVVRMETGAECRPVQCLLPMYALAGALNKQSKPLYCLLLSKAAALKTQYYNGKKRYIVLNKYYIAFEIVLRFSTLLCIANMYLVSMYSSRAIHIVKLVSVFIK